MFTYSGLCNQDRYDTLTYYYCFHESVVEDIKQLKCSD